MEEDYKKEDQESISEEYILNMRKLLISQKFFNQFKSINSFQNFLKLTKTFFYHNITIIL